MSAETYWSLISRMSFSAAQHLDELIGATRELVAVRRGGG